MTAPEELDVTRLLPEGRGGTQRVEPPVDVALAVPFESGQLEVVSDAAERTFVVPTVVDADGSGRRRAGPGDGLAEELVARLSTPTSWPPELEVDVRHAASGRGERPMGVDQTHESVIVGDAVVVKWTVAAEPGEQPAPAKLRRLDAAGFRAIPTPIATVTWRPPGDPSVLLASVDQFIPGASDGWTWYVDLVRAVVRGEAEFESAIHPAREIGRLTAQMHAAFAGEAGCHVLSADARDAAEWARAAREVLTEALHEVDGEEGRRLAARRTVIGDDLDRIADATPTPIIDIHGDFHVGQVLRAPHETGWRYVFTDFDGNPVLSLDERRRRQPAARDVAGMLASLDHVGRVVVKRTEGVDATAVSRWIGHAEVAFVEDYSAELGRLGCAELFDQRLIRGFRAEQECREFLYAARHLPHWRYVPDAALATLYPEKVL